MSTNADKVSAAPLGKTRFDYLIFVVAVCFLLIILLAGFIDQPFKPTFCILSWCPSHLQWSLRFYRSMPPFITESYSKPAEPPPFSASVYIS